MTTHSKRDLSIDLFNLPLLPDERNAMDSYLDVPNNFYIPDGKNLRLLQLTDRKEFDRKTISGNEGFVLEIPFLECAFGIKYYVVDKINGEMMGIFDDKVEVVEAEAQLQPFNLEQLNHTICILEQRRKGLDVSPVADLKENRNPVAQQQQQNQYAQDGPRLQYPTTPKEFNMSESLKSFRYDGNMLTSWARSQICWDHAKVVAEMADAYHVFCRSVFFNPEMANQYQVSMMKYVSYFTNIVRKIDVYLQEDQLMHTRLGFPLVPVPIYLLSNYKLEENDVSCIENVVYTEAREAEHEMLIILNDQQDQHDNANNSMHSSFSRLHSFKLNDMGFGLNRISPITFDGDIFLTPEDRGTKGRVPTSTPRKTGAQPEEEMAQQQQLPANRMYTTNQVPQQTWESGSRSYDADTSARDTHCICNMQGRYIPPQQRHPNDQGPSSGSLEPPDPHPGTSSNTEARRDFTSRKLGTSRPSIQCSACSEYNHWTGMCPHDNSVLHIMIIHTLHTCAGHPRIVL